MEYLFALLGLVLYLLFDAGVMDKATPDLDKSETLRLYLCLNIYYIIGCLIALLFVVFIKGNIPLPNFLEGVQKLMSWSEGDGTGTAKAFFWGVGIQSLLLKIRKYVNPLEMRT